MERPENDIHASVNLWTGLRARVFSALALGLFSFCCVWLGGIVFSLFVILCALIMKKEWDTLAINSEALERATGYLYIALPCASLIWLRNLAANGGFSATLALIAIVTATDTGAYFIGRRFGRHKLSPIISPNKTWEGLAGGMVAALITALVIFSDIAIPHAFFTVVIAAPFIALVAQAGDLFESSLKRKAGVKDSGTLLPGHGGLLDRFDGYMFAAPLFAFFIHIALGIA